MKLVYILILLHLYTKAPQLEEVLASYICKQITNPKHQTDNKTTVFNTINDLIDKGADMNKTISIEIVQIQSGSKLKKTPWEIAVKYKDQSRHAHLCHDALRIISISHLF